MLFANYHVVFVFVNRGCWMDVWELMSQECRDEVVLIDSSCLLETLETYLRKHRFVVMLRCYANLVQNKLLK